MKKKTWMNITLNIVRSFFLSYNVISEKHEKMFVRSIYKTDIRNNKKKYWKESNTTQLWENVKTFTCLWSLFVSERKFFSLLIFFCHISAHITVHILIYIYMWIHAIYIHYYMFCSLSLSFFFCCRF